MTLLLPGYALTKGRDCLAHRRFRSSPVTVCGYRVTSMTGELGGRRICPRCSGFLGRPR